MADRLRMRGMMSKFKPNRKAAKSTSGAQKKPKSDHDRSRGKGRRGGARRDRRGGRGRRGGYGNIGDVPGIYAAKETEKLSSLSKMSSQIAERMEKTEELSKKRLREDLEEPEDFLDFPDSQDSLDKEYEQIRADRKMGFDDTDENHPLVLPASSLVKENAVSKADTLDDYDVDLFNEQSGRRGENKLFQNPQGVYVGQHDIFFLQLPNALPLIPSPKPSTDAMDIDDPEPVDRSEDKKILTDISEAREGYGGKIMIYKSGKVKLKIGDTLFDVSQGVNSPFLQDVVSIDTESESLTLLGAIQRRVIVSPPVTDKNLSD